MANSPHVATLAGRAPSFANAFGTIQALDAAQFPILKRLAARRLLLQPLGFREPHWHANAHELGYCLRGQTRVTLFGNESERDSFSIGPGEMFFVPAGVMHHIENIGDAEAELVLTFSSESPNDFGLSSLFGVMSDAVLGNTFGLPASAFADVKRGNKQIWIGGLEKPSTLAEAERHVSPHKLSLEALAPPIASAAGSAKVARASDWTILRELSMYSVRVTDQGMREPHWHPDTAEMGYVAEGHARMTVLGPDETADTYTLQPGDVYFIPRAYPHHIENIGQGDIHFLIFFDQPTPGDVGSKALASAYSRPVLQATFGGSFPEVAFTESDPLIVPRINPVDP